METLRHGFHLNDSASADVAVLLACEFFTSRQRFKIPLTDWSQAKFVGCYRGDKTPIQPMNAPSKHMHYCIAAWSSRNYINSIKIVLLVPVDLPKSGLKQY